VEGKDSLRPPGSPRSTPGPDIHQQTEGKEESPIEPPKPPPIERHLDHESPFEVRPSTGLLAPASETEFLITFSPTVIGSYHNVVQLVLQCIPVSQEDLEVLEDCTTPMPQVPSVLTSPSLTDYFSAGPKPAEDLMLKVAPMIKQTLNGN
jgi:hypothetical protein